MSHPDLLAKDLAMAEPWMLLAVALWCAHVYAARNIIIELEKNLKGNCTENKVVILETRTRSKFVGRKIASEAYHQTWRSLAVLK